MEKLCVETALRQWRERVLPVPRAFGVVVAVSGGADSMALLHALAALREEKGLSLLAAHVHHGLRGEQADADEAFVREQCEAMDVPLAVRKLHHSAGGQSGRFETAPTLRHDRTYLPARDFSELYGSIYWDGLEYLDGLDRDDTIYTRYPEGSGSSLKPRPKQGLATGIRRVVSLAASVMGAFRHRR